VRTAGDRFALMQERLPDLGFDLVVRQAGRGGAVRPLPMVHLTPIPEAVTEGWYAFESGFAHACYQGQPLVMVQLKRDGVAVADGCGRTVAGRSAEMDEAAEAMSTGEAEAFLRAAIAESGLGADAVLIAAVDFTAVLSQRALDDRDWTYGREATLLVEGLLPEGARERLLNGFWATFRDELDAIEAARSSDGADAGALHPGSATRN
jgi:hypothetical protein